MLPEIRLVAMPRTISTTEISPMPSSRRLRTQATAIPASGNGDVHSSAGSVGTPRLTSTWKSTKGQTAFSTRLGSKPRRMPEAGGGGAVAAIADTVHEAGPHGGHRDRGTR